MHEIHGGSDLIPNDDYGISPPSVGQHLGPVSSKHLRRVFVFKMS